MSRRKKGNPVREAVEKILKKKNIDYNEWKKDVINKKKLAVMADEDKEWLEEALNDASLDLIMEEVVNEKEPSKESSKVTSNTNESVQNEAKSY